MIDLHIHTTASDGQYTPSQIVQKAAEKNLKVIAITDHDTINGLEEARQAAEQSQITYIPGIELNINFPKGEFHLLGLGITNPSASLKEAISNLIKNRLARNTQIISLMQDDGVDITIEELQQMFPDTVIGRPHLAQMLVEKGVVKNRQQAFNQYLANGRKWYVQRVGTNLDEAIIAIKESNGIPVIAHPMSLYQSWGKLPDLIKDYKDRGIMGLEAFHPGARVSECYRLEELAHNLGLLVTGGSDFHGESIRSDRRLGHICGSKKFPDDYWPPLKDIIPHY